MSNVPYWPNIPFVKPIRPLPQPDDSPLTGEQITVRYGVEYYAYIQGMFEQLKRPFNWQGDETQQLEAVQHVHHLLDQLITPVTPDVCEGGCITYTMDAPFITFHPGDPFRNPDYVPPGYGNPPFYLINGYPQTDLIWMTWNTIPLASLVALVFSQGFPRFEFEVQGPGEIEFHWHKVIQGGYAAVSVDNGIPKLIDLSLSDVEGLDNLRELIELIWGVLVNYDEADLVTELNITDPGTHHIGVQFWPKVNLDLGFPVVGYGGGIKYINLCGFAEVPAMIEFRFTKTCGLEYQMAGSGGWHEVPGWDDYAPGCYTGETGPEGPQGAPGEPGPGGNTDIPAPDTLDGICNAANYLADKVLGLVSAVIDGLEHGTLYQLLDEILGQGGYKLNDLNVLIASLELANEGWPDILADLTAARPQLVCVLYESSLDKQAAKDWAVGFEGVYFNVGQVIGQAIDAITFDKWLFWSFLGSWTPGSYTCSECGPWCIYQDFALADGSFTSFNIWPGSWLEAVGFKPSAGSIELVTRNACWRERTFAVTEITGVEIVYDLQKGTISDPALDVARIFIDEATVAHVDAGETGSGTDKVISWSGTISAERVAFAFICSGEEVADGDLTVKSIRMTGVGPKPQFGTDCE